MKDYQGVRWIKEHKRWQSSVKYAGIHYSCGMHLDQKEAVIARDKKIIEKNIPAKLQMLKKAKV